MQLLKCYIKKTISPSKTKVQLDSVYRDSDPSFATMKRWSTEFKRSRSSLVDDEHKVRLTTRKLSKKFDQMTLSGRQIKIRKIVDDVGISEIRVYHI